MKRRSIAPVIPLPEFNNNPQGHEAPSNEDPLVTVSDGRILKRIPVALIDSNPLAPRVIYTEQMIRDRADSLREHGQNDPIHVIPNESIEGRFVIADGWTRVQACQTFGIMDTLLAHIHTGLSLRDAAWLGYHQNEQRQQHTELDRAQFYAKLIAEGETQTEICKRVKISKSMMAYYIAFAGLPEELLSVVRDHPEKFSANAAYYLSRALTECGINKAVSIALRYADEDQTRRWLINQVQSAINPKERASESTMKYIKYGNGYLKQRGDEFEISIFVSEENRQVFAEKLEELLDSVASQRSIEPQNAGGNGGK